MGRGWGKYSSCVRCRGGRGLGVGDAAATAIEVDASTKINSAASTTTIKFQQVAKPATLSAVTCLSSGSCPRPRGPETARQVETVLQVHAPHCRKAGFSTYHIRRPRSIKLLMPRVRRLAGGGLRGGNRRVSISAVDVDAE